MNDKIFISTDDAKTKKGPLDLLVMQSMHECKRFPDNTKVLQDDKWIPIDQFMTSNRERILAQSAHQRQIEAERWAIERIQIKKAAAKKIAIGIPSLLAGLIITIGSFYQATQVGGMIILTYGLIGFGFIEVALGLVQYFKPEGGYT